MRFQSTFRLSETTETDETDTQSHPGTIEAHGKGSCFHGKSAGELRRASVLCGRVAGSSSAHRRISPRYFSSCCVRNNGARGGKLPMRGSLSRRRRSCKRKSADGAWPFLCCPGD